MFTRTTSTATILLLTITLVWLAPVTAKGPPIKVEQAIPAEAEQGQKGLPVTIKGRNFGPGSTVRYLVAGTNDASQIDVLSVVFDEATGDLDTVIDVDDGATISTYDIEVMRSGRGGKGTDLFRVSSKSDPPTPVDVTLRWLPSFESAEHWYTSAGELTARTCTPSTTQFVGWHYQCPHRIWPDPVDFDFSGVFRAQTKKRGEERLCDAMDGITMVANTQYTWYWEGSCTEPGGCDIYSEIWFSGDEVEQAVQAATGLSAPAVDFIRLKALAHIQLGSAHDANPFANNLAFEMDTATVRFIKKGTNRDAAICVYDWTEPGTGDPLVLETVTVP